MSEPGEAAVRVALVTGPDESTLAGLAGRLVDEGLAACVNLIPTVRSVYRWEGEVHDGHEALAIVKTTAPALSALERRIRELHPYEMPEFLVLAVDGSEAYLDWVRGCVTASGKRTTDG